ncbi:MAG: DNA polymerase I [Bacilli bacterium]
MKKLILIDGNNLMFRSYYATAYNGNMMKNSKGVPTNALFGFVSMIGKIMQEEKPEYMVVAFDVGKNFRKIEYPFYKEGRNATPIELVEQMPIARQILDAMNIKHIEMEPYEADDIIGTLAKMTDLDKDFASVIVSSDRDLLQLISDETEVKLLKQTGFIRYSKSLFIEDYGMEPIKIIDLKALSGDASDNIPGVKGIGEKTALKLLHEFGSLENLYENIDKVTGKVKEKLVNDKDSAFMSKKIATIYRDVPVNVSLEDLVIGEAKDELKSLYQDLEFFSFLKNMTPTVNVIDENVIDLEDINDLVTEEALSIYVELDGTNYHTANVLGMSLTDKVRTYFIKKELVMEVLEKIKTKKVSTYDAKKILSNSKIDINFEFDLMIASYLCNYNVKDDIAYLMGQFDNETIFYSDLMKDSEKELKLKDEIVKKSKFIYEYKTVFLEKLEENKCMDLFVDIEMPLIKVLSDMETTGIKLEKEVLMKMKSEVKVKIDMLKETIYNLAGMEFNISSNKQLGEVLFDKLDLGIGKRNKTGYKTDVKVLEKLVDKHPVVEKILDYRNLTKLYSTYIEGLDNFILSDGKIHTIYKQTLTRTGRLSSVEPNLQNIPVRDELGRKVRKAFVPVNDVFLSADYSQIELRILAHISKCGALIEAFKNGMDIHTKVASDIFGVSEDEVTKTMRRTAKAVIFGIVYGISGFGLGENLNIKRKDADIFIEKYYKFYPEVKLYMDEIIKTTHETGYVTTLFGRNRVIDEIKNPNFMIRSMGERMALNTPIQGTSADIMKKAMINVYNRFLKENITSKILLQVHDEIIVDCKNSELDKIKVIVKEEMENVIELSVPLKVSLDTGINWYEAN